MCGQWSCSDLIQQDGRISAIEVNATIVGNIVPCIMKKFGKPGTVVPRYAVGPSCASLYSFSVPLVPCTFKG